MQTTLMTPSSRYQTRYASCRYFGSLGEQIGHGTSSPSGLLRRSTLNCLRNTGCEERRGLGAADCGKGLGLRRRPDVLEELLYVGLRRSEPVGGIWVGRGLDFATRNQ